MPQRNGCQKRSQQQETQSEIIHLLIQQQRAQDQADRGRGSELLHVSSAALPGKIDPHLRPFLERHFRSSLKVTCSSKSDRSAACVLVPRTLNRRGRYAEVLADLSRPGEDCGGFRQAHDDAARGAAEERVGRVARARGLAVEAGSNPRRPTTPTCPETC